MPGTAAPGPVLLIFPLYPLRSLHTDHLHTHHPRPQPGRQHSQRPGQLVLHDSGPLSVLRDPAGNRVGVDEGQAAPVTVEDPLFVVLSSRIEALRPGSNLPGLEQCEPVTTRWPPRPTAQTRRKDPGNRLPWQMPVCEFVKLIDRAICVKRMPENNQHVMFLAKIKI